MPDLSWWLAIKGGLVELTKLDRDALHIYFATAIFLLTALVTRWRLDQWRTLVPLLLLELLNEAVDLTYDVWPPVDRVRQWWASGHDVLNTLVMPLVILLIVQTARRRPPFETGEVPAGEVDSLTERRVGPEPRS